MDERTLLCGSLLGLAERLGDGGAITSDDVALIHRVSRLLAQDLNAAEARARESGGPLVITPELRAALLLLCGPDDVPPVGTVIR